MEKTTPTGCFSMIPLEVWSDQTLTFRELKVLGVLVAFGNPSNGHRAYPSATQLCEYTGIKGTQNISTITRSLMSKGYIVKTEGERGKRCQYLISNKARINTQIDTPLSHESQPLSHTRGNPSLTRDPNNTNNNINNKGKEKHKELISDIAKAWNFHFDGTPVPKVDVKRVLRGKRATSLSARINEDSVLNDRLVWEAMIIHLRENDFYLGKNDRGWKVTFDYICNQNKVDKLLDHVQQHTNII